MSIKKLYSNYQDKKLLEIEKSQMRVDELRSHNDEYYIAQRDSYNQETKENWKQNVQNYENYCDYYNKYSKVGNVTIFNAYNSFRMRDITGRSLSPSNLFTLPESEQEEILNPKNIKMPSEPTPTVEIEPFQEKDRQAIQKIESDIEQMKTALSANILESQSKPIKLDDNNGNVLWLYKDSVCEVKGNHSYEELALLVMEFTEKEIRKFERLKNKFSSEKSEELKYERTRIPEEVRIAVWRRDQGRCARCGSRDNLEYDHIVPVSKGGGNTARNIELLCQDCNRAKRNRIE